MVIRFSKVISALPATLERDTVYIVRAGVGFDLFVSDATGTIAHKINPAQSWILLAGQWTTPPTQVGTTPVGTVFTYTYLGSTYFRLVPTTYDASQDAFYTTFAGGVLSGLIATRG